MNQESVVGIMFNINKKTKIFIFSPYFKTGGPKSLHQLASYLSKIGIECYVVYVGEHKKEQLFEEYRVNTIQFVDDCDDSIVIVPEIYTSILRRYKNVKKVIWWLSLDFYFHKQRLKEIILKFINNYLIKYDYKWPVMDKLLTKYPLEPCEFIQIYHFFNCKYVEDYLKTIMVPESHMTYLCGPLDSDFFNYDKSIIGKKKNIVTVNPSKMDECLIERIRDSLGKLDSSIKIVRLKNMTKKEVIDNLIESKVYMDLGFFPGPERIPREAVTLFCNIITSKTGSASNPYDVPISDKYKFDTRKIDLQTISNTVLELLNHYDEHLAEFENYRQKTIKQMTTFEERINSIFSQY